MLLAKIKQLAIFIVIYDYKIQQEISYNNIWKKPTGPTFTGLNLLHDLVTISSAMHSEIRKGVATDS